MFRLWCLLIGYVFGLFQTAYIIGKAHGIDIRQHGSGNSGTTNMLRTLGTKAGIMTFLGDCLKCVAAVFATWFLFKAFPGKDAVNAGIRPLLTVYTSAGVILGHNFPCTLGFKGGKGIASTAGMCFMLSWWHVILGSIAFFGSAIVTHYVSLGSLLVYAVIPVVTIVLGQTGVGAIGAMTQPQRIEMYVVVILLGVLAYWQHRANIKRLLTGTERKSYLFKKKSDR